MFLHDEKKNAQKLFCLKIYIYIGFLIIIFCKYFCAILFFACMSPTNHFSVYLIKWRKKKTIFILFIDSFCCQIKCSLLSFCKTHPLYWGEFLLEENPLGCMLSCVVTFLLYVNNINFAIALNELVLAFQPARFNIIFLLLRLFPLSRVYIIVYDNKCII